MTTYDQDRVSSLLEHARRITSQGGGDDGGTSDRITRLETHMEYVRRDLESLRIGQDNVSAKLDNLTRDIARDLAGLPTRKDLQANIANTVVIGLTVLAITLTGIVGGLTLINHYAAAGPAMAGAPASAGK